MSENLKIWLGYAAICFLWGSTWLVIKWSLTSISPMMSGGLRFMTAAAAIYALMKYKKLSLQNDKLSWTLYLLTGFFSFLIPFALVYWAEQFISSGLASVLFAVYPFSVALLAMLFVREEKAPLITLLGMVLGFGGIIFIFSDGLEFKTQQLQGMIAVVVSAVMQSGVFIVLKKKGKHLNPLSMNFIPMLISGIGFLIVSIMLEINPIKRIDLTGVLSVLYLALLGSVVTFTTYYWLLKRINAVLLSLVAFITPVIALLLGWFFAGEQLNSHQIIGSLLVLFGLLLANLKGIIKILRARKRFLKPKESITFLK